MDTQRTTRLLQWSLTLAIVIVLNLLFNVGTQLFIAEPRYEDFCKQEQVEREYTTQESCLAVGGQWFARGEEATPSNGSTRPVAPKPFPEESRSYCNAHFTCAQEYDVVRQEYNRNIFIVLVTGGLIALLLGVYATLGTAVSLGFTWGGVLSFIIASMRYWSDMNEYLRFVLLIIVLIVLVWLGVKKLQDK
ncbi:MAG: hypothetical protein COV10_02190 [Candidatus Vogelbacteria bacterium CG10_big_fil_rev_8_21_14_0_10_51_16]|uniref:Uncharacterized protein n=1 Tax=Candidatus Vogelbacteria bacterium CG10_big_fil_rev_8_21_14_0_10_51_16 TaxID=1975045 RepID=A0A2H0REP6_9BACT|nr:MAG: hypothetical protein COV10_02190 [Candidatus Vogelbacteria bacterium CG10_big_fil_rev_8_21_14_0_10_51_16]